MSAIFLPRRWRHQPQGAVEVDPRWGCAGAFLLTGPSIREPVWGKQIAGTGTTTVWPHGKSRSFSGSQFIDLGVESYNGINLFVDAGKSFSVVHRARGNVVSNAGTIVGRASSAGDRTFQTYFNNTLYLRIRSRADTNTGLSVGDGRWHTHSVVAFGNDISVYADKNDKFITQNTSFSAEEIGQRIIFGARTNGTGFFLNGSIEFVYFFARALSYAEHLALEENPYQLFRAPSHRIWFDLGAGGSPGIYTLDAQPISIGASPQAGSPLAQRRLSADSASITITGEIATLVKVALVSGVWDTGKWDQSLWDTELLTYSFAADPVQVALTGGEAATAAIRRLSADPATTSITAQASATLAKRALDAQAVSVAVTGADAGLNKLGSYSIEAQPITLSLTAQVAGLAVIRRLSADPITVTLTVAPATGYARRLLAADAVAVSISGMEAGLHRSGYYPLEAGPAPVSILLADAGLVVNRLGQSVRSTGGGGSGGGQLWRKVGEEIEEEMHALLRDPEPVVAHPVDASPLKEAVVATLPEQQGAEEAFAEALREYQLAQAELLRRRRERRKRILLLS